MLVRYPERLFTTIHDRADSGRHVERDVMPFAHHTRVVYEVSALECKVINAAVISHALYDIAGEFFIVVVSNFVHFSSPLCLATEWYAEEK